jgi:uncharacterized protein (TIGR03067 family)
MYANAVLVLSLSVTAPQLKDKSPKEPPIFGDWLRVGHTEAGAPVPPDREPHRQVFKSDGEWEYYYADRVGSAGGKSFVVDPRQTPPAIDIHMDRGAKAHWRGIYKVEGDTLTLCLVTADRDRPRAFESSADRPTTIWVFKRVQSKD